ncbi:hypothetical protein pb186bvf_021170 [Paramecium bursaria]
MNQILREIILIIFQIQDLTSIGNQTDELSVVMIIWMGIVWQSKSLYKIKFKSQNRNIIQNVTSWDRNIKMSNQKLVQFNCISSLFWL